MKIPSKQECCELIREMGMMTHIVAHSVRVCRVALFLTDRFTAELHIPLHRELIRTSALLHDITKTRSFKTGENHSQTGKELLTALGYPEVGHIVGQHVRLNDYDFSGVPTEAEIVNYSDKRVLHDTVVPLNERMDYIIQKYGNSREKTEQIHFYWKKTAALEEKLFRFLPFSPSELSDFLLPEKEKYDADLSAYHGVK
jgi:putative nucleotidyltransferase with HDIG domain